MNYVQKLRICDTPWVCVHHRSGWRFALESLRTLHSTKGVRVEGIIEKRFVFGKDVGERLNDFAPIREPWIGFFHNPPYVPEEFGVGASAGDIIALPEWRESMEFCLGIFTLSTYLAEWLRPQVNVTVCAVPHPTEDPTTTFSFDRFRQASNNSVIHIGWWLRKFCSFYALPVSRRSKTLLQIDRPFINDVVTAEKLKMVWSKVTEPRVVHYLDNPMFDDLLAANIVFADFYDSSANNTVIECLVRNTPIIVNRHPAVEEYLGSDYPLFFNTLEEAGALADDDSAVAAAHEYMIQRTDLKMRVTGEYFVNAIARSSIYQALPLLK